MKTCNFCNKTKPVDEFSWKSKAKGIRNSRCKSCYSEYNRRYYANGERTKQIVRAQKRVEIEVEKYKEWKTTQKCALCSEDAPECLDLHHIDPSEKDLNPSDAARYGMKRFLEEAAKCVVLCSNCHRKIHSGRISLPQYQSRLLSGR